MSHSSSSSSFAAAAAAAAAGTEAESARLISTSQQQQWSDPSNERRLESIDVQNPGNIRALERPEPITGEDCFVLSRVKGGKSHGESMAVEEEGLRVFQSVKIKIGKKKNPYPQTERLNGWLHVNGQSGEGILCCSACYCDSNHTRPPFSAQIVKLVILNQGGGENKKKSRDLEPCWRMWEIWQLAQIMCALRST